MISVLMFFSPTTLRRTIIISGILVSLLVAPLVTMAASVVLSPATGSYNVGQTFTVAVRVAPTTSVNAVEAQLAFDPAILSVVNITKDGSVFTLWTTEPTFSNSAGTISFGGGSPTPFSSQSNLVNVTFRTVAAGSGNVRVTNASVLAADGQGTDVYRAGGASQATFTIATAPATPPPTTPSPTPTPTPATPGQSGSDALVFGDPPRAPEIGSQVFLDPDVWYRTTEGLFAWTLPFDVNGLAILISTTTDIVPKNFPDAIVDPPVDEFRVTRDIIVDGEQYIHIQFKNQVGWGAVTTRKLLIDTIAPEPFTIDVRTSNSPTGFPTINFEARDLTSGIAHYDMFIADKEPIRVTPDEARLGYLLRDLEDGTYTVRVIAFDRAGNQRESTAAVLITAGWTKPVEQITKTTWRDVFTGTNIFITLLFIIIGSLLAYIWYDKKQIKLREEKLRRETKEIQDQMEKIFSALRDEIYDQINTITKRKRLSKNEKEAVDGLHQALEVSETLIEKEINDVKTILR